MKSILLSEKMLSLYWIINLNWALIINYKFDKRSIIIVIKNFLFLLSAGNFQFFFANRVPTPGKNFDARLDSNQTFNQKST